MPASPTRIAFVSEEFRSYVASDAAIRSRYGPAARDTLAAPVTTFFDLTSDAAAMCDERFALLKGDRRKFQVVVQGVLAFTGALDFSQVVPAATLVDDEKNANLPVAIVGIAGIDYDAERTTLIVWG